MVTTAGPVISASLRPSASAVACSVGRGDDAGHAITASRWARCRQVVEQVRASIRVALNVLPQTSQEIA